VIISEGIWIKAPSPDPWKIAKIIHPRPPITPIRVVISIFANSSLPRGYGGFGRNAQTSQNPGIFPEFA
jgi:hypothetical protein